MGLFGLFSCRTATKKASSAGVKEPKPLHLTFSTICALRLTCHIGVLHFIRWLRDAFILDLSFLFSSSRWAVFVSSCILLAALLFNLEACSSTNRGVKCLENVWAILSDLLAPRASPPRRNQIFSNHLRSGLPKICLAQPPHRRPPAPLWFQGTHPLSP